MLCLGNWIDLGFHIIIPALLHLYSGQPGADIMPPGVDFVEAPSQMLENWCWQPAALHRMSRHHASGAPIPEHLLAALLRSRQANQGVLNMRQVVLGTFDQAIHTAASCDSAAELARVTDELMGVPATPGTNMAASFGHLAGGYDAQWNDDVHHALHVLLTGEDEGYYRNFADDPARHLARCLGEGFAYQGEFSPSHGRERGTPSAGTATLSRT